MFKIEGLTFRYPVCEVFRDYRAEIPENALIYGPNGCGKTTLLKLIGGVLSPGEGIILWNDSSKYRVSAMLNAMLLYDDIRLDKQLSWICSVAHRDRDWLLSRCEGFNIESLFTLSPREMSQGMRQWATLAFVCAMPADAYLLDEPLAGLDDTKCQLFYDCLKVRISQGESFIITGHGADDVSKFPGLIPVELRRESS